LRQLHAAKVRDNLSRRDKTDSQAVSRVASCCSRRSETLLTRSKASANVGKDRTELLGALGELLAEHGMALQTSSSGGEITLVTQPPPDVVSAKPIKPNKSKKSTESNTSYAAKASPRPVRRPSRSQSPDRRPRSFAYSTTASATLTQRGVPAEPTPISFEYDLPSDPSWHADSSGHVLNEPEPSRPLHGARDVETTFSPHEESHGTLVIDKSGRSRYLGPTAGPEWLRDVSSTP